MRTPRRALAGLLAVGCVAAATAAATASPPPTTPAGAAPRQDIPDGQIQVQGRILYIDRNSDRSHAAAGLRVEIWDKDERGFTTGQKLGEAETDTAGFFQSGLIDNADPDGPSGQLEGTQDVFLKLRTNNGNVKLLALGTTQEYGWASYEIDAADGLRHNVPDGVVPLPPLYMMENTRDVEAMWSFVNLVEGWRYLKDHTGVDPGPVTAYWSNVSQDGPRYDPSQAAIYLRDADAGFSSVVLQQEAFALLHNALGDLPAPWLGCTDGDAGALASAGDQACALVRGFATFFALAVKGDPEFDSLGLRGTNLDTLAAGAPGWDDGDGVAGRVAGAFWDLHEGDTTEEFYDAFNATFQDIWSVFGASRPATLAAWWAGWRDLGNETCPALGSLFQNTIDYNTPPEVDTIGEIRVAEDTGTRMELADLVTDAECGDEELTYSVPDPGRGEAGVSVEGSVLVVDPEENWFGETDIRLAVSDGPATIEQQIHIIVEAVNDAPEITPTVPNQEVLHGEAIVLNLLPNGVDVEDPAVRLAWFVELEPGDAPVVDVSGQGTSTLTFRLNPIVVEERSVRAVLVVRDTEGGEGRQAVVLTWTERPNDPPFIWWDRFQREYTAAMNHKIEVDVTGVAGDAQDDPDLLAWYASGVDFAQVGGEGTQVLEFDPDVDFVGQDVIELEVRDLQGATATGVVTLTWDDPAMVNNQPPRILRNRLFGKTVGTNGVACYPLADKAVDPDDPIQSLQWFVTDYENGNLRVTGQGTQSICLISRPNFKGCQEAEFVVRDPKGAEDSEAIRTCWKTISLFMPTVATLRR